MKKVVPFLLGVLRLSLAFILTCAVIGGITWGIMEWRSAPLKPARSWPAIKMAQFDNVVFELSTRWNDGFVLYRFNLKFVDQSRVREDSNEKDKHVAPDLTLNLMDKDGFTIERIQMDSAGLYPMVGADEKLQGWTANSSSYMDASKYSRVAKWDIELGLR